MTDMQLFAFIFLPIGLMIVGTIIAELIIRRDRRAAASQAAKLDVN